ncbi:PqqD family protein [Peribacillus frigoritolerans]|uniref:PqqD family protein n=1 Tax=Peribacillus TaxID=2675229 RepID=UPI0021AAB8E2|nr:PqqD family protein [Peribacillus frigoritolerans]MCT4476968.1 PqqD family protein [Peribacillus frigoritolerans]
MLRKSQSKKRNLLTMVPLLEKRVTMVQESSEATFLVIQRTNFVERITIRFFKQPSVRKIKLDKFGAYAIKQMEFQRNVNQISEAMSEHFGEEAEPALPRLMKFLEILEVHDWIIWNDEEEK